MRTLIDRYRRHRGHRSRGQSLTEFALVLPVFLLVVLIGLDFGRAYLGFISLQQSARIAANFASLNPTAWNNPGGNANVQADYQVLVKNDAAVVGCTIDDGSGNTDVPDPVFASVGKEVGTLVTVTIPCQFDLITPMIGAILTNPLPLNASSTFPVRVGMVAGGSVGGPVGPIAGFSCTPTSGPASLAVNCTDASLNAPSTYAWDFNDDGATDATTKNASWTYTQPGKQTVKLTVGNFVGTDSERKIDYIDVQAPPPNVPVADFTGAPLIGDAPLTVVFTDASTNSPTTWAWDFNNDGIVDDTKQVPDPFVYSQPGVYTVVLTVTNAFGSDDSTKTNYVNVTSPDCQVPNVKNMTYDPNSSTDQVDLAWAAAGFTQPVAGNPQNSSFTVKNQDPAKNLMRPCFTQILTVSP